MKLTRAWLLNIVDAVSEDIIDTCGYHLEANYLRSEFSIVKKSESIDNKGEATNITDMLCYLYMPR